MQQLTEETLMGRGCSPSEALELAHKTSEEELFEIATRIRELHFGNEIQLCSITNAKSGQCDMDCCFCSQSGHNTTDIDTYPFLGPDELKGTIERIVANKDRHCGIVTSGGRLSGAELTGLTATVRKIGGGRQLPVCASLGRLTKEELALLKEAGITRFHHNLESSEKYYPEVCTTQTWQQRLDTVKAAQASGLKVCCGGLFGLGESWEDRIDLAFTLRTLDLDSVPINFLYPHKGTPMHAATPLPAAEALRIIAIYRLMLPKATLRICGGRTHILGDRQADLFTAGANGLMTGNYLTVTGSQYESDLEMIHQLGLRVASGCAVT